MVWGSDVMWSDNGLVVGGSNFVVWSFMMNWSWMGNMSINFVMDIMSLMSNCVVNIGVMDSVWNFVMNSMSWEGVVSWINMSVGMSGNVVLSDFSVDMSLWMVALLISMSTNIWVVLVVMMNWVVSGVVIWVVGIVMILHPLVGVDELMLIGIIRVIVSIWLESVIFPVV